jgi:hypothetical protein
MAVRSMAMRVQENNRDRPAVSRNCYFLAVSCGPQCTKIGHLLRWFLVLVFRRALRCVR